MRTLKIFVGLIVLALASFYGYTTFFPSADTDAPKNTEPATEQTPIMSTSTEPESDDVTASARFKGYTKKLTFDFDTPFELSLREAGVSPDGTYFIGFNGFEKHKDTWSSASFIIGLAKSGGMGATVTLHKGTTTRIIPESLEPHYVSPYVIDVLDYGGNANLTHATATVQVLNLEESRKIIGEEIERQKAKEEGF